MNTRIEARLSDFYHFVLGLIGQIRDRQQLTFAKSRPACLTNLDDLA